MMDQTRPTSPTKTDELTARLRADRLAEIADKLSAVQRSHILRPTALDRSALAEHRSTLDALIRRGLVTHVGNNWYRLTDAGAAVRKLIEPAPAELPAIPQDMMTEEITARCPNGWHRSAPARARQLCPECETGREVYDPYWVRNLVDRVGRELHDMDMLAAACAEGEQAPSAYQRGQRDTWAAAADYLQSAVRQSVARLGLAELLDASRAGASMAELAAIPQSREV